MTKKKKHITKPWSDFHTRKYRQLYNYMDKNYDGIDQDTFMNDEKRKLVDIIEKNPKWGDSNKMALFFTIARWLFNNNNEERYVKIYSQKGYELQMKIKKITEDNTLDEKEMENFRDYEYFENILKNKEVGTTLREHYQHLLLACLILQPPLRTGFYTTARLLEKANDDNKEDNFVNIQ